MADNEKGYLNGNDDYEGADDIDSGADRADNHHADYLFFDSEDTADDIPAGARDNAGDSADAHAEAEDTFRTADEDDDPYDESLFQPIDVSEPRAPIKEMDVIEEALAIRRRDWIRTHSSYIFAAVGVVIVAVIAALIYMYFISNNPMSRFSSSLSKNFGSSFSYDVQLTENGQTTMRYDGAIEVSRSAHTIKSYYEADYGRYQFAGTLYADKAIAKKGSYYKEQWQVRDCIDDVQDFFDFDRDFRSGEFDAGSFLRFTGLTSDFSTRELNGFINTVMKRLTTDSAIATITAGKEDGVNHYHYDVSLQELFEMVKDDGASIFYRATDYDKFCAEYEINKGIIEKSKSTIDFMIDASGHMTALDVSVTAQGVEYGLKCRMSDFGEAQVEVPQGFLKAASITPAE
ncbi:MAG: hypothetical protein IJH07_06015 [Ruminococcus sp.]|nr:hypothetical protein [Ruminococcus sp.]